MLSHCPAAVSLAAATSLALASACGGEPDAAAGVPEPAAAVGSAGARPEPLPSVTGLVRWPLSQEEAEAVFAFGPSGNVYDPLAYFRRPDLLDGEQIYAEYPGGRYRVRTNSLGMREDGEVSARKPDLRVLVTGDSHTDGVCANADSYANRLERLLAEARPERTVEVLNNGCGAYSFYNYLGVLELCARLDPDVFVVGVFGGNDFGEVLAPWYHFRGEERPVDGQLYRKRLQRALEFEVQGRSTVAAISQGFNQYFYFDLFRGQMQVALEAGLSVMDEIAAVCRARGIALIVVYIPPPAEIEYERSRELFDGVAEAFSMSDGMVVLVREHGARFVALLRERGIAALDARDVFAGQTEPLYWLEDLHIDLRAHRLLAEALAPLVESAAAAPR